jgi:hypothetical protein
MPNNKKNKQKNVKRSSKGRRSRSASGTRVARIRSGDGDQSSKHVLHVTSQIKRLQVDYSSAVAAAAASIALPLERHAVKVGGSGRVASIANPRLSDTETLDRMKTGVDSLDKRNNGFGGYILVRSPLLGLIKWIPDHSQYAYIPHFAARTGAVETDPASMAYYLGELGTTRKILISHLTCGDEHAMHGPILYPVRRAEQGYYWQGPGSVYFKFWKLGSYNPFTGVGTPLAITGNLRMYILNGDEETVDPIDFGVVNADFKIITLDSAPGTDSWGFGYYIRFELEIGSTTNDVEISMQSIYGQNPTNNAGWAHLPMAGYVEKASTVQSIGIAGMSLLLSNRSRMLDKNGSIVMAQFPKGDSFWDTLNHGPAPLYERAYSSTTSSSDRLNFETGGYCFAKPDVSDLSVRAFATVDVSEIQVTSYGTELTMLGDWLYAGVSLQKDLDQNPLGNIYDLQVGWSVCFQTMDPWYAQVQGGLGGNQINDLVDLLGKMDQFHCNPFHFSDILGWLKKAGSTILNVAPGIAEAVSAAMPETAPVLLPMAAGMTAMRAMRH